MEIVRSSGCRVAENAEIMNLKISSGSHPSSVLKKDKDFFDIDRESPYSYSCVREEEFEEDDGRRKSLRIEN
jgi:hypothetical protein